jgi:hypothetical protein
MLGFSSISELALAQLPSTFAHFSGVTADAEMNLNQNQFTVNGFANVSEDELGSVSATTTLADLANVTGTANITLDGISATLSVTSVIVWGKIIPAPGTSYTAITPSSSPTWSEKTTGVSQTWTEVA